MALAELGEVRPARRELAQHDVKPHAVHALVGEALEQAVRERVEARVEQRVAEERAK